MRLIVQDRRARWLKDERIGELTGLRANTRAIDSRKLRNRCTGEAGELAAPVNWVNVTSRRSRRTCKHLETTHACAASSSPGFRRRRSMTSGKCFVATFLRSSWNFCAWDVKRSGSTSIFARCYTFKSRFPWIS